MQTSHTFLSFQEVAFAYHLTPVLTDLSFSVSAGEVVGFLGVNGAGKTTSFLLANGFLKPSSGRVTLFGQNPRAAKDWCYKVGVLMTGFGVYPRLTVRRNLSFFAELYRLKVDLDGHLEQHGLTRYASKPAGQLSQGFRRRLGLARATLHSPQLLLLDEPADGLDPSGTEHLHSYLQDFRRAGGAVLYTSHRLEEVERICDRVVLLNDGKIALEGTPDELVGDGTGKTLRDVVLGFKVAGLE